MRKKFDQMHRPVIFATRTQSHEDTRSQLLSIGCSSWSLGSSWLRGSYQVI